MLGAIEFRISLGNAGTGMCQRGATEHGCEFAPVAGTYNTNIEILNAPCSPYVASAVDEPYNKSVKPMKNRSQPLKAILGKGDYKMYQNTLTLSNGVKIPQLGLGTWFIEDNKVAEAVKEAAKIGYRHFDTAQAYGNEVICCEL